MFLQPHHHQALRQLLYRCPGFWQNPGKTAFGIKLENIIYVRTEDWLSSIQSFKPQNA